MISGISIAKTSEYLGGLEKGRFIKVLVKNNLEVEHVEHVDVEVFST